MKNIKNFVAINYIDCTPEYVERFEQLFASRAGAIDRLDGFQHMQVLKPKEEGGSYLVVSHWESEDHFKAWTKSPEFLEGHKRAFADMAKAREEGKTPPMKSTFKVYDIISR
jgi:heme oxygenase (mycobilin-producing)